MPYALYMVIPYNKCWCCLRIYYIIKYYLRYFYSLLRLFTSIVGGGGPCYILLLDQFIATQKRLHHWSITYPDSGIILSLLVHSGLPVFFHLIIPMWVYSDSVTRSDILPVMGLHISIFFKVVSCCRRQNLYCGFTILSDFQQTSGP